MVQTAHQQVRTYHWKELLVLRRIALRTIAAATASALAATALPAAANATDNAEDLSGLLSRVAPEVLEGLGHPSGLLRGEGLPTATVPTTPGKPVTIHGQDGTNLSIKLPKATSVEPSKVAGTPVTVFEHDSVAQTVPLPKDDGSVQIVTVLESESSPEAYTYQLELPGGTTVKQDDEGLISFVDAEGNFSGGITPAWAKDARGAAVPTHYEISGTTLTQIVEHVGRDVAYPIVADPWLGKDLYGKPRVAYTKNDKKHKGYSIVVRPTGWGKLHKGVGTFWAHRDEVKTKLGKNKKKWTNSIQEQFYCHINLSPWSWLGDPDYNMESWRPTVNWWVQKAKLCNPEPKKK